MILVYHKTAFKKIRCAFLLGKDTAFAFLFLLGKAEKGAEKVHDKGADPGNGALTDDDGKSPFAPKLPANGGNGGNAGGV